MPSSRAFGPLTGFFVGTATLTLSLVMHWRLRQMMFDDSYIHLRIARNMLRTGHAYFNQGERVMATSSPLWTVLLYALRIPRHPGELALLEGGLLWIVAGLAVTIAWRTAYSLPLSRRISLTILACLLSVALTITSTVGGMETPLAVACLLGAWVAALDDRPVGLLLLALGACTRLELLPLFFVAVILQFRRHRIASLASLAIIAGFAVWTCLQFGVLLPNSMRAKSITYGYTMSEAFHQFVAHRLREELVWPLLPAVSLFALWQCISQQRVSRTQWLSALALCTALGLMVIYVLHETFLFPWYRPLYELPLALGLLLYRDLTSSRPLQRILLPVAQGALLIFFFVPNLRTLNRYVIAAIRPTVWNQSMMDNGDATRVAAYLEVADVLRNTCPHSRLMATEIGALGWEFDGHVDDAVGIASPNALKFQPLRSGAFRSGVPVAYVAQELPDTLVDYAILDTEMIRSGGLHGRYDLVQLPPSPRSHRGGLLDRGWRGSKSLDVWLRRDGPCDTASVSGALRSNID